MRKIIIACLALLPILGFGQTADLIPKHLELARELLENVSRENNRYAHTDKVLFPTDEFSHGYSMNADCSGLVYSLLERARSETAGQIVKNVDSRSRPLSEDFALSILKEKGFQRIRYVSDIWPGDILVWEWKNFLDARLARSTGHTMVIDSVPKKISPRSPMIPDTEQFELWVIDSSKEIWGPDDTRRLSRDETIKGLGRGRLRVYVATDGSVVGYAKNFREAKFTSLSSEFSHLSQNKPRLGFIGRPLY